MHLQEKFIDVGKTRVFYEEVLPNERAPTLIFLHGLGLCNPAFRSTIRALGRTYRVIAPDLPGFGRSQQLTGGLGYYEYANFVSRLMTRLKIKRAHLLGHSLGGGICAATAALYPSQVASLILLNSSGIPLPPLQKLAIPRLIELFGEALQIGVNFKEAPRLASYVYRAGKCLPFWLKIADVPLRHDLRPILHRIQTPTILAWGKRDHILPMSMAKEIHSHIPNARLEVIDDGYHDWSLLFPERVVEIAQHFYARLPKNRASFIPS